MTRFVSRAAFGVAGRVLVLGGLLAVSAGDVAAQGVAPATAGRSSVSFTGGLAGGGTLGSGVALGGSFTFGLTDRLGLEGTGTYLRRGAGADAVSMNLGLVVNLVSPSRSAVPYLAIGGGAYRASFDLAARRFFGMMSEQYPAGTQLVPLEGMMGYGVMMGGAYYGPSDWMGHRWNVGTQGPWPGPVVSPGEMPMFYARRLGPMTVPAGGMWGRRTFTDPALVLGGGVRLDLSRHLSVRPDVRAIGVVADGEVYTVGVFSFNVGYRF